MVLCSSQNLNANIKQKRNTIIKTHSRCENWLWVLSFHYAIYEITLAHSFLLSKKKLRLAFAFSSNCGDIQYQYVNGKGGLIS